MYSIPYIFEDVIKNKLQNEFNSFSDTMIHAIIKCLTNPKEQHKYVSIISKFHDETNRLIIKIVADILESIDDQYFNSKDRKLIYESNKRYVSRTITTVFGDLTFRRNYYKSKLDGSCCFVLDEVLGLPKNDRYDPVVKALAINTYTKTNMSIAGKIVGEQLTDLSNLGMNEAIKTIPRQSIYNWIKDWNIPNLDYEQRPTPDTLFLMGDEKFIGCQDKENDIMIKSFVIFEGVEHVSKGRNRLVNKTVINMISSQPWVELTDILFKIYDSQKVKKIYFISDGGLWLKKGVSELKVEPYMEIKHLLCEFHFKQAINNMTTDAIEREILKLSFQTDSKNEFKKLTDEIINNYPNRTETIEKKVNYILNNYNQIKDMLEANIGSSMEAHISHCVANQFGSRPKGYSSSRIQDYIKLNNFTNNNINIYKLYTSTYDNTEVIALNEKQINYSVFDRKNDTNVPVLSYGQNTSLYQALNDLSHGINKI